MKKKTEDKTYLVRVNRDTYEALVKIQTTRLGTEDRRPTLGEVVSALLPKTR